MRNRRSVSWGAVLCGVLLLASPAAPAVAVDPFAALKVSRAAPGTAAPAFTLKTVEGRDVSSKDLAGKVVMLNFWATWCGPCKEEMPALERLRRQFDSDTFVMLAVTTDIQRGGIKAFVSQLGLGFPVLLDEDRNVSAAFMVRGLPMTVLIGKDGKLVGRAAGPREWDSPQAVALIRSMVEPGK